MDIDKIGNMIIGILTKAGYFVCLAVVIKDILSCVSKKDVEGIIKAVIGGVIGYYVIGHVDDLFKLID